MRFRRRNTLLNVLIGTGLYLLDPVRDRLASGIEDLTDRAQDTYEMAAGRMGRATQAMRGEDHRGINTTAALLLGVGIGVGVGMLLAPASGEEIRSNLADKVQDFGGKMKSRFAAERESSTGTYGK